MPKEKSLNPVAAAKKAEKQRALKKSKANVQAQRNEKLARRNPQRLQREIDDLKHQEQAGELRPHDRQRLQQLEKDVGAIRKAREVLGDKAPQFKEWREGGERGSFDGSRGRGRGGGVLGKRRRDGGGRHSDAESSSDTDEEARSIPMPKDTPPPIPHPRRSRPSNANDTPLGESRIPHALPAKPAAQITLSAAPQIRDLRKEATSRFMPAAVQNKMKLAKGQGRLLEPEELEKLEKEGYRDAEEAADAAEREAEYGMMVKGVSRADKELDDAEGDIERELRQMETEQEGGSVDRDAELAAEAAVEEAEHEMMAIEAQGGMPNARAESEQAENVLRHVEMEEVEDEDL